MDMIVDAIDFDVQTKDAIIDKKLEKEKPKHLKHSAKKYVLEYLRCKKSFEYFVTTWKLQKNVVSNEIFKALFAS